MTSNLLGPHFQSIRLELKHMGKRDGSKEVERRNRAFLRRFPLLMMTNACLTVTLNPAVDKFVEVPLFRLGTETRCRQSKLYAGGKGINVSRALNTFRIKARATGFLGGMTGQWIRSELRREKVAAGFVAVSGETRTNLTVVDPRMKTVTRVLEAGPPLSVEEMKALEHFLSRESAEYRYVVFSGSCPPKAGAGFYRELIRRCQGRGQKSFLDTSGPALRQGLRAAPYGVKPNRQEAEFILGEKIRSRRQIKAVVRKCHQYGVQVVLLSLGPAGVFGSDGLSCWQAAGPQVPDPAVVGCGDAALAGYLYGEIQNQPFCERVAWAAAAGTANALSCGPCRFSRLDVNRIKRKIQLFRI